MIHKKITSSLFAFTIAACSIQAAPATAIAKDAKLEQQVEATLSKMTLEEKIGQMTELAIDVLGGLSMENSSLTKLNCARPLQNIK